MYATVGAAYGENAVERDNALWCVVCAANYWYAMVMCVRVWQPSKLRAMGSNPIGITSHKRQFIDYQ